MNVNGKKMPGKIISRMGGGEDEGEWWRGEFKYDIFDIL
jgi:hypothetical protein